MDDLLLVVAVVVLGIGGLLGIAYSLDIRRSRRGPFGPKLPPPGPVGRVLWWTARLLAVAMALSVIGAYAFHVPSWAWFTAIGFVFFFIDHTAYRIVRLTGK